MILITAKESGSAIGKKIQKTMDNDKALNFARECMLMLQPMDETSADVMAINFMAEVEKGKVKVIENTKNNHVIVFQTYNEINPEPLPL